MIGNGMKTSTSITRILLVDDHPIVVEGLSLVIQQHKAYEICGYARRLDAAVEQLKTLQPDLILLDISLEKGSGIDLLKYIKQNRIPVYTLVISMHEESIYIERAMRAGANGYLVKREAINDIMTAIECVLQNKVYLSQSAVDQYVARPEPKEVSTINPRDVLSKRELQVFYLLGTGYRRAGIAEELYVSVKTIDTHLENIKRKLEINSIEGLYRYSVEYSHDLT